MRTAVYFGTRNLYQDMIPAAKSLLYNSNVEKIYLLIEDNVFPYELPPIIETINFSQQKWFSTNGPNYNGRWTYMGLARAVFTKLFPEQDIILYGPDFNELRDKFREFGMDFFDRTGAWQTRGRGWEILEWLNGREVDSFVILDDWDDMGPISDHLIWTNPTYGLTEEQVQEAIEILNRS